MDVFTDRAFAGNPLAVVFDADRLSTEQMQSLAREFNLSETTFVLPPTTDEATYRARIFTGKTELPFAGHPPSEPPGCWCTGGGTKPAPSCRSAVQGSHTCRPADRPGGR